MKADPTGKSADKQAECIAVNKGDEGMYDLEKMYELATVIYSICMDLIPAIAYGYLIKDFVKSRRLAWITGVIYIIPMLPSYFSLAESSPFSACFRNLFRIFPFLSAEPSLFPASGFSIFLGLLAICFWDRRQYLQKLFLAVTFFSVRWFAFRIQSCIGVLLDRQSVYYPGYWENELTVYILFSIISVIEVALGTVLLFLAVIWIKRAYRYKREELQLREFVLMTMPSAVGLMAYIVYRYMENLYDATGNSTYDAPLSYHWFNILFCLTMYISIIIVIVLFQNIKDKKQEEKQKELLKGQMEDMKHHISRVEELYRELRSMKHDMGNHVAVMESLCIRNAEEGIRGQMQAYVSAMKEQYSYVTEEIRTGNPITDVILMEKQREAAEKGIAFTCEFRYPKDRRVDAFDLSIILNNALENAIEAVERMRKSSSVREMTVQDGEGKKSAEREMNPNAGYIKIRSYMRKNAYMIEVINSYQDKITFDMETGLPNTMKEQKESHGYGLRNIREVARKYYGEIDIETTGEEFCLSVMLSV